MVTLYTGINANKVTKLELWEEIKKSKEKTLKKCYLWKKYDYHE